MSTMTAPRRVKLSIGPTGDARWMRDAACKGVQTNIFFTEIDALPSTTAQRLCAGCQVQEQCLQWALEHDEEGYWGGTTYAQREAIMSGRHRIKCPGCRSRDVAPSRGSTGQPVTVCLACGLSW